MAYAFSPDCDVLAELRHIAHDQVSEAIADLSDARDDLVEAVHDMRKRCKKVRGLVRLVRPALGPQYSNANATFRDAANEVSPLRDVHALLETFDTLCAARHDQIPDAGLDGVRAGLQCRCDDANRHAPQDDRRVAAALGLLRHGEGLIDSWGLAASGFEAFAGGLAKTYARGRKALHVARESPTTESFHEYRKRVKYTWYHVRLLEQVAPSITKPLERLLHGLGDTLGDEHDLAVLSEQILAAPEAFGGDEQVARAMILVDGQRADLQRHALSAGGRVHAETPKAFVRRLQAYWDEWRAHGPELEAGAIADLVGPKRSVGEEPKPDHSGGGSGPVAPFDGP